MEKERFRKRAWRFNLGLALVVCGLHGQLSEERLPFMRCLRIGAWR
jgi:hypothetical protein